MSKKESELFHSFITKAETYLEFGCGGSTYLASHFVKKKIISVDSSPKWIDLTKKECQKYPYQCKPIFYYADIGSIGEWGTPNNEYEREKWLNYHTGVWGIGGTWSMDLYFIDGRFRVACFAQIYRRCDHQSIIGVHDFLSREKHYGPIRELGREIASAEDISFFLPIPDKMRRSQEIIDEFAYNYK
jgi:hypothetical protein